MVADEDSVPLGRQLSAPPTSTSFFSSSSSTASVSPTPAPAISAQEDIGFDLLRRYEETHDRSIVLEALESVSMPESRRKNVRAKGDERPIYGMCLGLTEYNGSPCLSAALKAKPLLTRLLCLFAQEELPGFVFTSIQVNKDYAAALHVDGFNLGASAIIGLGDYVGGELWLDDGASGGEGASSSVPAPRGRVLDLRGQWHRFCGQDPHCVLPFKGRRYTLVYFARANGAEALDASVELSGRARRLVQLGFQLPTVALLEKGRTEALASCFGRVPDSTSASAARIEAAQEKFCRFCARDARSDGPGRACPRLRLPSGKIRRVSIAAEAPLQELWEALAKHLRLPLPELLLRCGSRELLPSDTLEALGFQAALLDVLLRQHLTPPPCAEKAAPCSNAVECLP